ncbi:Aldehyde dehydrogenase [Chytriomyces hyalinus]|nr:Aldehyde dehydrogenase [Chytriomyces hyalinus]
MPTPLTEIEASVSYLRKTFDSNKTKSIEWRRDQLTRLFRFVTDKQDLILEAVAKDNQKSYGEIGSEMAVVNNEIAMALHNLDEWTQPKKCKPSLATITDRVEVRHEPLGVVLIIGAWNFNVQLVLAPLAAALAAGNCAIIKPSEVAPHTEAFLANWLPKILDNSAIRVVTGGVPETTRLLELKFDLIFYTGGGSIGKIIMSAAAKQLTPVILELGGKSPVYIHSDADIEVAAQRIIWAKTVNCGQICLAPDYVMANKSVISKLIPAMKKAIVQMCSENPQSASYYARIINSNHTQRLKSVLDRQLLLSHSKLEAGGTVDVQNRFIAPTLVSGVKTVDPLMEDEIFGPLLGLVEVADVDEAISIIKSKERPLSLYIFAKSQKIIDKITDNTLSGSVLVNDLLMNMIIEDMPFGGVGSSGMGAYHGHSGFLGTFSHQRGYLHRGTDFVSEKIHSLLYAPVSSTPRMLAIMQSAVLKKPPTALGRFLKKAWPVFWRFAAYALVFEGGRRVGLHGMDGVLDFAGDIAEALGLFRFFSKL